MIFVQFSIVVMVNVGTLIHTSLTDLLTLLWKECRLLCKAGQPNGFSHSTEVLTNASKSSISIRKMKCSFGCFPGSHGGHLFSTEPEDKSARAGARGGVQSSPETQHEETHLNRHVGTHAHGSLSSFDLTLSPTLLR